MTPGPRLSPLLGHAGRVQVTDIVVGNSVDDRYKCDEISGGVIPGGQLGRQALKTVVPTPLGLAPL